MATKLRMLHGTSKWLLFCLRRTSITQLAGQQYRTQLAKKSRRKNRNIALVEYCFGSNSIGIYLVM